LAVPVQAITGFIMQTPFLIQKIFTSHSGLPLSWKIDCDALSQEDLETLALLVATKIKFSRVIGIPTGGLRFAEALEKYVVPSYPTLIVDDVLTTGASMELARKDAPNSKGIVIFSSGPTPKWIQSIFKYTL